MNRRTLTLIELREIRNIVERAYDKLHEMNCYALSKAEEARQYLADSLHALKSETDAGENHNDTHWPGGTTQ